MGGLVARAIRANRFARIIRNSDPYFYSASGRFARIIRIPDSHESLGDRGTRTIPTKDLPHQVVVFGGWCANCRNLGKIRTTPSFALAMLIVDFVGVARGFRGLKFTRISLEFSEFY